MIETSDLMQTIILMGVIILFPLPMCIEAFSLKKEVSKTSLIYCLIGVIVGIVWILTKIVPNMYKLL